MKRLLLIFICISLVFSASADDGFKVKKGQQVPQFSVEMFDGSKVDISQLKGKVVLINFWATWCPPCRAELKRVQAEIIDKFAGQDFVFLPISRGETRDKVSKFREDNNYSFAMGLDPETNIFPLFAKDGIPRNFIIDRNGKIVYMEAGYTDELFADLIKNITKTLNSK